MSKIILAADASAVTRDSRKSNQFIEQFNKQVLESAKDGYYYAKVYIRYSDDIEDLEFLYKDLTEDDPDIIAVKEAGYKVHILHNNNGFHSLLVCWNEHAEWDEEAKDFVLR